MTDDFPLSQTQQGKNQVFLAQPEPQLEFYEYEDSYSLNRHVNDHNKPAFKLFQLLSGNPSLNKLDVTTTSSVEKFILNNNLVSI